MQIYGILQKKPTSCDTTPGHGRDGRMNGAEDNYGRYRGPFDPKYNFFIKAVAIQDALYVGRV